MDQMCETEQLFSGQPLGAATADASRVIYDIDNVDLDWVAKRIESDLVEAEIDVPLMLLFPSSPTNAEVHHNDLISFVMGAGPQMTDEYLIDRWECMNEGIFAQKEMCGLTGFKSAFSTIPASSRIFSALHETAHYIARKEGMIEHLVKQEDIGSGLFDRAVGLEEKGLYNELEETFRNDVRKNASECIADASAILYIYSNVDQRQQADQVFSDWVDLRSFVAEPTHFTVDVLQAAKDAFADRPVRNLSIVDSTKWAFQIVDQKKYRKVWYSAAHLAHFVIMNDVNGWFEDSDMKTAIQKMVENASVVRQKYFDRAEEAAKNVPPLPKWKSRLYGLLTRMPVYLPG